MSGKPFIPQKLRPWIEARNRFQLSHAQVQMARELGMNPKKLGKIDNHKQERWKLPLRLFIEECYRKRFGRTLPADCRSIEEKVAEKRAKKESRPEPVHHTSPVETSKDNRLRVIVDECVRGSPVILRRFEETLAPSQPIEWIFLSKAHRAIPDAEILGRLLGPESVLLTCDRVLHNQALRLGFRSYFLNENGETQRESLPGISAPQPVPVRRDIDLKENYAHPANPIASGLKATLSESDIKRYRTRRRRIRSYFGSGTQISSASLTIGARASVRGNICGYFLALAGDSGVKGIRASEGYALAQENAWDPAHCIIHALRELYLLQLENVQAELFIIPGDALALCERLTTDRGCPLETPSVEALRTLLSGLKQVRAMPCAKGRFFDAMEAKLDELTSRRSNELVSVDFDQVIAAVLHPPALHQPAASGQ